MRDRQKEVVKVKVIRAEGIYVHGFDRSDVKTRLVAFEAIDRYMKMGKMTDNNISYGKCGWGFSTSNCDVCRTHGFKNNIPYIHFLTRNKRNRNRL